MPWNTLEEKEFNVINILNLNLNWYYNAEIDIFEWNADFWYYWILSSWRYHGLTLKLNSKLFAIKNRVDLYSGCSTRFIVK